MNKDLFRGKIAESEMWVCGDLIHDYYKEEDICVGSTVWGIRPVDPATVGQRIGLEDRNQTAIFEGDVVHHEGEKILGVVKYSEDSAAFVIEATDGQTYDFVDLDAGELEVVGNIHDNPELLKA